jgi:hypothetical protein
MRSIGFLETLHPVAVHHRGGHTGFFNSTPYPGRTPPYQGNITEPQDVLNACFTRLPENLSAAGSQR